MNLRHRQTDMQSRSKVSKAKSGKAYTMRGVGQWKSGPMEGKQRMRDLKQAVIEELKGYIVDPTKAISEYEDDVFNYNSGLKTAIQAIEELLTADVVKVVRCKDCIYGIPTRIDTATMEFSDGRYCNRHHMCHFEDYYCADGKRKEGGTE